MRPDHPHTFADVTVVDRTEFGWLCQIENRCVFVDKHQVEPETPIPSPGERGPLTIAGAVGRGDPGRHPGAAPALSLTLASLR